MAAKGRLEADEPQHRSTKAPTPSLAISGARILVFAFIVRKPNVCGDQPEQSTLKTRVTRKRCKIQPAPLCSVLHSTAKHNPPGDFRRCEEPFSGGDTSREVIDLS